MKEKSWACPSAGLSLVELLVGLCLLAVLSSFAFANVTQWVEGRRAETSLTTLRAGINIARHTAINKNVDVIVCPSNGSACGPRNSWHLGTLIFEDHDQNRMFSAADVRVAHLPPINDGFLYWRAFRNRNYLLFTSRGITDWQNGHFLYCAKSGEPTLARQLVLNYAGRTYPSKDTNDDGVHENVRGQPLDCP